MLKKRKSWLCLPMLERLQQKCGRLICRVAIALVCLLAPVGCWMQPNSVVSSTSVGPSVGFQNQGGDFFQVYGLSLVKEARNRGSGTLLPAACVMFVVVEVEAKTTGSQSWSIPFVIVDRFGQTQLKNGAISNKNGSVVEASCELGRSASQSQQVSDPSLKKQKLIPLRWSVDCSSRSAEVQNLLFNGKPIDLTKGTLLLLQNSEAGALELIQREWLEGFEKKKLTGSGRFPRKRNGGLLLDRVARMICEELGY